MSNGDVEQQDSVGGVGAHCTYTLWGFAFEVGDLILPRTEHFNLASQTFSTSQPEEASQAYFYLTQPLALVFHYLISSEEQALRCQDPRAVLSVTNCLQPKSNIANFSTLVPVRSNTFFFYPNGISPPLIGFHWGK